MRPLRKAPAAHDMRHRGEDDASGPNTILEPLDMGAFFAAAAAMNPMARSAADSKGHPGNSADAGVRLLLGNFTFRLVR